MADRRGGGGGRGRSTSGTLSMLGGALCLLSVLIFFARGRYVYNYMLDSQRSAIMVKSDWFGASFVDFATVQGVVDQLWESIAEGSRPIVELPFSSPVAMSGGLGLATVLGIYLIARGVAGR